ncbi:Protein of unknown function [Pyronema omphalodes CBS 100304]|uniref:Uncharacterized protein n=1 Tax=Pyronema omphalodes (strain CBS 100304) TaxID=1076935 RepID=U4LGA1_PYROM|nr:Protein of unknown function [Pyronema omphalodes CBS 100304]
MTKDTPVPQPETPRKTVTFCNTVQVRKFKKPPLPTRKARNGKRYVPEEALDAKCEDITTDGTQPIHDPDRTPKKVYGKEKMMVFGKEKSDKEEDPGNEE